MMTTQLDGRAIARSQIIIIMDSDGLPTAGVASYVHNELLTTSGLALFWRLIRKGTAAMRLVVYGTERLRRAP